MNGLRSWWLSGLFVLSACGSRSALDSPTAAENGASPFGGAPGLDDTPPATAGRSNQAQAGTNSGGSGGSSGSADVATGDGGAGDGGARDGGAAAEPRVVTTISAGTGMTCATMSDGSVWCWGGNDHGQLGDGTTKSSAIPVRVLGINSAVAVTAGGTWSQGGPSASLSAFGCAVLREGTVQCWGLQRQTPSGYSAGLAGAVLTTIPGVSDAVALAGGNRNACALTSSGSVWCWNAVQTGESLAVQVAGITGATAVAGQGSTFDCAVLADGSVQCWGAYNGGTDFDLYTNATNPVRIPGVSASPSGLAVGREHACAISPDGSKLQCWGVPYFNLPPATESPATELPVTVQDLPAPAIAVSAGAAIACVLLSDGTVQCLGDGRRGELGTAAVSSSTLVTIVGIADAVALSVGYLHACVLTRTGSVRCWGANDGDLGNGGPTGNGSSPNPVTVIGL